MDNLTIVNKNGQLVVSSRKVAENFEKEHFNLIRDIENIFKNEPLKIEGLKYFIPTTFIHKGNNYKEYLLTKDGFSLLVMGFTGSKALGWKIKYIDAFNKMENSLKSVQPKLSKELQAIFTIDQRTVAIDNRLVILEGNMTIDYSQQEELRTIANKRVIETLGGKDAPAYKECSKKAFSELWKAFKRVMQVNSYRNTAAKEYAQARETIKLWEPNRDLELMILGANSQLKISM